MAIAGHHHHDVEGDLAQGTGDQAKEVQGFCQPIAGHVPGGLRHAQAEFGHQRCLHIQAFVAEGGEGAGGPGELADFDAWAQFHQALGVAVEHA